MPSPEEDASFGRWGGACREAGSGACRLVPEGNLVEVLAAFRPEIRVYCAGETTECLLILDDTTGVGAKASPEPKSPQEASLQAHRQRPADGLRDLPPPLK